MWHILLNRGLIFNGLHGVISHNIDVFMTYSCYNLKSYGVQQISKASSFPFKHFGLECSASRFDRFIPTVLCGRELVESFMTMMTTVRKKPLRLN
jgi:hypothetical protein